MSRPRSLLIAQRHDALLQRVPALKAKRTPTGSQPGATKPNEWWGIDMTKLLVEGFGWVYIVVVLDWYTKKIVGYYAWYAWHRQALAGAPGYGREPRVSQGRSGPWRILDE